MSNIHIPRRTLLAAAAIGLTSTGLLANDFPQRPIRLVVPAAAGGGTHLTAQLLAEKMSSVLGQRVIVDARPGAGGNVGAEIVARSQPDGYTMLMSTIGTHGINKSLYKNLPFDPAADFEPVSLFVQYPLLLVVNPGLPVKSVSELIAYCKTRPGAVSRASSGIGTSTHLAGEMFVQRTGIESPHAVYKGSAPAVTDLMGNHVQYMFDSVISTLAFVESGKLRALAITSKSRSPLVPAVPTMSESGMPGFEAAGWTGLSVPARTPAGIIATLNAAVVKALAAPDLRESLLKQAAEPIASSPQEFRAFAQAESARWRQIIRTANISAE